MNERSLTPDEDLRWQALTQDWRTAPETGTLDELRPRAARQHRRQLLVVAGEAGIVLAFLALSLAVLAGQVQAWEVVWLTTLWAFTTIAVGFAWWNRRATWRVAGETVEHYVRLSRLRAERQLRSVRFALWLLAVETVVVAAQLLWFDRLVPLALVALGAAGVVIVAWCLYTRRRLLGELARIAAFERDLADP
jgi:hypothetical protein